jgi:hypothetical protein
MNRFSQTVAGKKASFAVVSDAEKEKQSRIRGLSDYSDAAILAVARARGIAQTIYWSGVCFREAFRK